MDQGLEPISCEPKPWHLGKWWEGCAQTLNSLPTLRNRKHLARREDMAVKERLLVLRADALRQGSGLVVMEWVFEDFGFALSACWLVCKLQTICTCKLYISHVFTHCVHATSEHISAAISSAVKLCSGMSAKLYKLGQKEPNIPQKYSLHP